jgi:cytochrome d ubiquinol oxidase subunit I
MATLFGVLATAGVITLGDALGFVGGNAQPSKLAAMEAMWQTDPAPAPFNVAAWPSQSEQRNTWSLQIPYVLTPLLTHTMTKEVPGIQEIKAQAAERVRNGIPAVEALKILSKDPTNAQALAQFKAHEQDLGFGFLVQRYAPNEDASQATDANIAQAANDTIPAVAAIFWTFRIMVAFGLLMLAYFIMAVIYTLRNDVERHRWFLKLAPWMIPIPFLACEMGWLVAELGRQPWTVYEMLPTWMSASTHSVAYMVFSLTGFVLLYSIFIAVEMYLMVKFIRKGPDEHSHEPARPHAPGGAYAGAGVMMKREEI